MATLKLAQRGPPIDRPFKPLIALHTSPHVSQWGEVCKAITTLTIVFYQTYQKDITNIEREWEIVWEFFPEQSSLKTSGNLQQFLHLTAPPLTTAYPLLPVPLPPTLIHTPLANSTILKH